MENWTKAKRKQTKIITLIESVFWAAFELSIFICTKISSNVIFWSNFFPHQIFVFQRTRREPFVESVWIHWLQQTVKTTELLLNAKTKAFVNSKDYWVDSDTVIYCLRVKVIGWGWYHRIQVYFPNGQFSTVNNERFFVWETVLKKKRLKNKNSCGPEKGEKLKENNFMLKSISAGLSTLDTRLKRPSLFQNDSHNKRRN